MSASTLPLARHAARATIRVYQLTLSSLTGRQCRHLPTCSDYAAEAIARHGVWAGGWMGFARICRCGPGGTSGLDFVCDAPPEGASALRPWRYARWRGTNVVPPLDALPSPLCRPLAGREGGPCVSKGRMRGIAPSVEDHPSSDLH